MIDDPNVAVLINLFTAIQRYLIHRQARKLRQHIRRTIFSELQRQDELLK